MDTPNSDDNCCNEATPRGGGRPDPTSAAHDIFNAALTEAISNAAAKKKEQEELIVASSSSCSSNDGNSKDTANEEEEEEEDASNEGMDKNNGDKQLDGSARKHADAASNANKNNNNDNRKMSSTTANSSGVDKDASANTNNSNSNTHKSKNSKLRQELDTTGFFADRMLLLQPSGNNEMGTTTKEKTQLLQVWQSLHNDDDDDDDLDVEHQKILFQNAYQTTLELFSGQVDAILHEGLETFHQKEQKERELKVAKETIESKEQELRRLRTSEENQRKTITVSSRSWYCTGYWIEYDTVLLSLVFTV